MAKRKKAVNQKMPKTLPRAEKIGGLAAIPKNQKKLMRKENGKIFGGVIAGISQFLGVEPFMLRFMFLIIVFFLGLVDGFQGLLVLLALYLLSWCFLPIDKG